MRVGAVARRGCEIDDAGGWPLAGGGSSMRPEWAFMHTSEGLPQGPVSRTAERVGAGRPGPWQEGPSVPDSRGGRVISSKTPTTTLAGPPEWRGESGHWRSRRVPNLGVGVHVGDPLGRPAPSLPRPTGPRGGHGGATWWIFYDGCQPPGRDSLNLGLAGRATTSIDQHGGARAASGCGCANLDAGPDSPYRAGHNWRGASQRAPTTRSCHPPTGWSPFACLQSSLGNEPGHTHWSYLAGRHPHKRGRFPERRRTGQPRGAQRWRAQSEPPTPPTTSSLPTPLACLPL